MSILAVVGPNVFPANAVELAVIQFSTFTVNFPLQSAVAQLSKAFFWPCSVSVSAKPLTTMTNIVSHEWFYATLSIAGPLLILALPQFNFSTN